MALDNEMKRLINKMAELVRQMYGIPIPINDIDSVVRRMNGIVKENINLDSFSDGRVRKNGEEGFVIEVSPFQPEERRNFTIAHELGHLFLHMGYLTNEDKWKSQDDVQYYRNGRSDLEYQSNEFAAAFLMPKEEYRQVMDENTEDNLVNTAKIAKYFNVSVDAAANRGKWLGYLEW